jgi:N4-gp56 family major capsid protein
MVNYAMKYSEKVDERFRLSSVTHAAFNQDYDWEGVQTVYVYSVQTAPLNNYLLSGTSRYGSVGELATACETMTLTQDKSFTFSIDRRNYSDQMMVTEAGLALARQMDEVVVPTVDRYRLLRLVMGAGTMSAATPVTQAYSVFLNGVTTLLDNNVPLNGTVAFVGTNFYKAIRLDPAFIQSSDMGQKMLVNGQVGTVENIPLIFVPAGYLPSGIEFILVNRSAAVAPMKLSEYKIHDNPPGRLAA